MTKATGEKGTRECQQRRRGEKCKTRRDIDERTQVRGWRRGTKREMRDSRMGDGFTKEEGKGALRWGGEEIVELGVHWRST